MLYSATTSTAPQVGAVEVVEKVQDEFLSFSQRRKSLQAECWKFWSFFREGNHCQPNVGNFDRFAKKDIIASRMLEILIVVQRRKSLLAECWKC